MSNIEKYNRRRVISSYFSVILSLTLILFLLGTLGLLVLNTNRLGNYFKQQISLSLVLKDEISPSETARLQQKLEQMEYVHQVIFVSKEQAAAEFSKEIGEDFLAFIGDNPLKDAIEIKFRPEFVSPDQIKSIAHQLGKNKWVKEVTFDEPLVASVYRNVEKISWIILSVTAVLIVFSILLINTSIRLSVYSKRFSIKTMQMVGATKSFIRRPFIRTNIVLGMISSLIAILLLSIGMYHLDKNFKELYLLSDFKGNTIVFLAVFFIGMFISGVSTFFATQRFLNLHTDKLYY